MAHELEEGQLNATQLSAAELAAQQVDDLHERATLSVVSASAVAVTDPWTPWSPYPGTPGAPPCLDDGGYATQTHAVRTACWHDPLYATH